MTKEQKSPELEKQVQDLLEEWCWANKELSPSSPDELKDNASLRAILVKFLTEALQTEPRVVGEEELGRLANEYAPNESDEDARFHFIMGFEKAQSLNATNAIAWPSLDEIKKATKDYATLKLYGFDEVIPSRYDSFKAGVEWLKQRLNGVK